MPGSLLGDHQNIFPLLQCWVIAARRVSQLHPHVSLAALLLSAPPGRHDRQLSAGRGHVNQTLRLLVAVGNPIKQLITWEGHVIGRPESRVRGDGGRASYWCLRVEVRACEMPGGVVYVAAVSAAYGLHHAHAVVAGGAAQRVQELLSGDVRRTPAILWLLVLLFMQAAGSWTLCITRLEVGPERLQLVQAASAAADGSGKQQ